MKKRKPSLVLIFGYAAVVFGLLLNFFVLPAAAIVLALTDPGLRNGEMPAFVYRWHRALSQDMEDWAVRRVVSGVAAGMDMHNISGTEWPVFSSVFYLWTTETLQDAWVEDPSLAVSAPVEYASGAIEAVTALVADPNHAAWVQQQ